MLFLTAQDFLKHQQTATHLALRLVLRTFKTLQCFFMSVLSMINISTCLLTSKYICMCFHTLYYIYILFFFFSVKIGLFYIVYYTFLTGFFIAMLVIFYQTLDEKVPKWQNSNGIIGANPGKILFIITFYEVLFINVL